MSVRDFLQRVANTARFPAPEWMDEITAEAKALLNTLPSEIAEQNAAPQASPTAAGAPSPAVAAPSNDKHGETFKAYRRSIGCHEIARNGTTFCFLTDCEFSDAERVAQALALSHVGADEDYKAMVEAWCGAARDKARELGLKDDESGSSTKDWRYICRWIDGVRSVTPSHVAPVCDCAMIADGQGVRPVRCKGTQTPGCQDAARYQRFGTMLPLGERPKETDAEILARSSSGSSAEPPAWFRLLEEFERLASPVPWNWHAAAPEWDSEIKGPSGIIFRTGRGTTSHEQEWANGRFITALRNAWPQIKAAITSSANTRGNDG